MILSFNLIAPIILTLLLLVAADEAPAPDPDPPLPGDTFDPTDKYIIVLKPEANATNHKEHLRGLHQRVDASNEQVVQRFRGILYEYDIGKFRGYAGHFDPSVIERLRHNSDVALIEPDRVWELSSHLIEDIVDKRKKAKGLTEQKLAPVGLQIISHNGYDLPGQYVYDKSAGAKTYGYIIDTGIDTSHTEFTGGRASWGYTAIRGAPSKDLDGHGTAMAGITGGKTYGVAKKCNLIAVKAVQGQSTTAIVLDALQWTTNDIVKKKRVGKAVINMSLGGSFDPAFNAGINAVAAKGITIVVAAGNENRDARHTSPASAQGAIAVAAIDDQHRRAPFSNWGSAVTIFAPGVRIQSSWISRSWIGRNRATKLVTGTSPAAPFVAGLVLYLKGMMELPNANITKLKLMQLALKNKVVKPFYTPNVLAYNGCGK